MNENLTRREKLVEPTTDLHPTPGHRLVVFKRVRGGLEFRSIVDPGQSFKRFFLESPESFVGLNVSCDRHLRLRFRKIISALDGTRGFFTLHGTLFYHVRDPRILAESIERDPLRRVQEEAIRILVERAELLDWSVIEADGPNCQSLLERQSLQRIQDFSRILGIEVTSLELTRKSPADQMSFTSLDYWTQRSVVGSETPSAMSTTGLLAGGALPEVLSSAFGHVAVVAPVARYSISLALLHLLGELLADRARALDFREELDQIFQAKVRELSREQIPAIPSSSRDEEITRLYEKLATLRSLEERSSNGQTERELDRTFARLRKLQLEEAAELRSAAEEKLLMPLGAGKELLGRIDRLLLDDEDRAP
jgi:hypothetical protein